MWLKLLYCSYVFQCSKLLYCSIQVQTHHTASETAVSITAMHTWCLILAMFYKATSAEMSGVTEGHLPLADVDAMQMSDLLGSSVVPAGTLAIFSANTCLRCSLFYLSITVILHLISVISHLCCSQQRLIELFYLNIFLYHLIKILYSSYLLNLR